MKYIDLFMIYDGDDEIIDFLIHSTDLSSYQSWVVIIENLKNKKLSARMLLQRTFE